MGVHLKLNVAHHSTLVQRCQTLQIWNGDLPFRYETHKLCYGSTHTRFNFQVRREHSSVSSMVESTQREKLRG